MKVYYLTNTDKFIDIKINLAFLSNPIKIPSIDDFSHNKDTWKSFINLTDNNLFFHNDFIFLKKLILMTKFTFLMNVI